jgi:hypothetical protein
MFIILREIFPVLIRCNISAAAFRKTNADQEKQNTADYGHNNRDPLRFD